MHGRSGRTALQAEDWRAEDFLAGERGDRFVQYVDDVGREIREHRARARLLSIVRALLSLSPSQATTGAKLRRRAAELGEQVTDRFMYDPPFVPEHLVGHAASAAAPEPPAAWVVDELVFRRSATPEAPSSFDAQGQPRLPRVHEGRLAPRRARRRDAKRPDLAQRAIAIHASTDYGDPLVDFELCHTPTTPQTTLVDLLARSGELLALKAAAPLVTALHGFDADPSIEEALACCGLCSVTPVADLGRDRFRMAELAGRGRVPAHSPRTILELYTRAGRTPVRLRFPDDDLELVLVSVPVLVDGPASREATLVLDVGDRDRKQAVLERAWLVRHEDASGRECQAGPEMVRLATQRAAFACSEREADFEELLLDSYNHGSETSWRSHCALVAVAYAFIVAERRLVAADTD